MIARALRRLVAGAGLLAIMAVAGACGRDPGFGAEQVAEADAAADWAFTIPAGAGAALDAGEPLEILPARLDVSIGQIIEIRNDDDRGHLVGPFFVGEGETLRHRFTAPGEFVGTCTVHPSGEIVVVVT